MNIIKQVILGWAKTWLKKAITVGKLKEWAHDGITHLAAKVSVEGETSKTVANVTGDVIDVTGDVPKFIGNDGVIDSTEQAVIATKVDVKIDKYLTDDLIGKAIDAIFFKFFGV